MRITKWFIISAVLILGCGWSVIASADPGDLDPAFGVYGKRTLSIDEGSDEEFNCVVELADGSFITAGRFYNGSNTDVAVAKFKANGGLEQSFGTSGIKIIPGNSWEGASAIHLLPNNEFLVAGFSRSQGQPDNNWDFLLMKFHADGSLDTNFGTGGKVVTAISADFDWAKAIAVQDSGRIVVGGIAGANLALVGYTSNGMLDSSFGIGGIVNPGLPGLWVEFADMAMLGDGRFLIAGNLNSTDLLLARYTADGFLDNTFRNMGYVVKNLTPSTDRAQTITVQPDGKIIVGGFVDSGPNDGTRDLAMVRFDSEGFADPFFGTAGIVIQDLGGNLLPGDEQINHLALQNDGKILAIGSSNILGFDLKFLVARFQPDGDLDPTFDGGTVLTDFSSSVDVALTGFVSADRLLVIGSKRENGDIRDVAMARYLLSPDVAVDDCGGAVYCDLFEDGILSNDWHYDKPAWNETGGALVAKPTGKKASAIAPVTLPVNDYTIQTSIKASNVGDGATVWLLGWYTDKKNTVELLMKEGSDKWLLKHRVNGVVVAKAKGSKTILPNTTYSVKVSFDGSQFQVFIDDVASPLITMPTTYPVNAGFLGFQAKDATAHIDAVRID